MLRREPKSPRPALSNTTKKRYYNNNMTKEASQDNYSKWGKCTHCGANLNFSRIRPSGSIELRCPKCNKWASLNKKSAAERKPRKPRKPYNHEVVNGPCECGIKPRKMGRYNGRQRVRCPGCKHTWYDLADDLPTE